MATKRILGIDPGSRNTGIGVIDFCEKTKNSVMVYAGCIKLTHENMACRLGELYFKVRDLVAHYLPNEISIEQVFVHHNVSSALKLGQARGVAIAASVASGLPIFEYAPTQIKQAVTGMGRASKAQVQHMCQALFKISNPLQADAADALAVALTHAHSDCLGTVKKSRHRRNRGLNWSENDCKLAGNISRN
jgi:crossover junction endodeoxyribonuclease RuvC